LRRRTNQRPPHAPHRFTGAFLLGAGRMRMPPMSFQKSASAATRLQSTTLINPGRDKLGESYLPHTEPSLVLVPAPWPPTRKRYARSTPTSVRSMVLIAIKPQLQETVTGRRRWISFQLSPLRPILSWHGSSSCLAKQIAVWTRKEPARSHSIHSSEMPGLSLRRNTERSLEVLS